MTENNHLIIEHLDNVRYITLNRPEKHNAMNHEMVSAFSTALDMAADDSKCRLIVLQGLGKSFCAGHDLNWMRDASEQTMNKNRDEAQHLADFFDKLYHVPQPTIAIVQGPAYGGGVCLMACCDYVLATPNAHFGFPEVKMGLIPAVIIPFIINAIGARQAKRYFITGESFTAETAKALGLVHDIINADELRHHVTATTEQFLKNGPNALVAAKQLVETINPFKIQEQHAKTTARIAELRTTPEALEGISAFFEHREPSWRKKT